MTKGLKKIGIIVLSMVVIVAVLIGVLFIKSHIDSQKPYLSDTYYTEFKSDYELEKKYSGLGGFDVSNIEKKSDDKTLGNIRVWYPTEIERKAQKYPLIVLTNASNTAALNYIPFFKRLASWGFIVVGNDDRQAGSGLSTSKTLDYMLALNDNSDSVFLNKIDQNNIGIVGHSQGGAGAIRAVTEFDNSDKYKTIFTGSAAYALLAKNMGWEYDISKVIIPYLMTAGTGKSDDAGVADIEIDFGGIAPLASLVQNYNGITSNIFKIRARVFGAEHEDILVKTDAYMTAWMMYQLQGDEQAAKVFIGGDAELLKNSTWQDIEKSR